MAHRHARIAATGARKAKQHLGTRVGAKGTRALRPGDHVRVGGGALRHTLRSVNGRHAVVQTPAAPSLGGGRIKRVSRDSLTPWR